MLVCGSIDYSTESLPDVIHQVLLLLEAFPPGGVKEPLVDGLKVLLILISLQNVTSSQWSSFNTDALTIKTLASN